MCVLPPVFYISAVDYCGGEYRHRPPCHLELHSPVLECKMFWNVQKQSELSPLPPSQLWLFLLYLLISLSLFLPPQPLWVPDAKIPAEQVFIMVLQRVEGEEKGCPLFNFWLIWEITSPRCLMEKKLRASKPQSHRLHCSWQCQCICAFSAC